MDPVKRGHFYDTPQFFRLFKGDDAAERKVYAEIERLFCLKGGSRKAVDEHLHRGVPHERKKFRKGPFSAHMKKNGQMRHSGKCEISFQKFDLFCAVLFAVVIIQPRLPDCHYFLREDRRFYPFQIFFRRFMAVMRRHCGSVKNKIGLEFPDFLPSLQTPAIGAYVDDFGDAGLSRTKEDPLCIGKEGIVRKMGMRIEKLRIQLRHFKVLFMMGTCRPIFYYQLTSLPISSENAFLSRFFSFRSSRGISLCKNWSSSAPSKDTKDGLYKRSGISAIS